MNCNPPKSQEISLSQRPTASQEKLSTVLDVRPRKSASVTKEDININNTTK